MVDPSAQSRRPQHQLRRLDSPPFPVRLDPPFSRHPRVLRSAVHRLRSPRCNGDPFRAEQMAGRSGNGRKWGRIVRFPTTSSARGAGAGGVWSRSGARRAGSPSPGRCGAVGHPGSSLTRRRAGQCRECADPPAQPTAQSKWRGAAEMVESGAELSGSPTTSSARCCGRGLMRGARVAAPGGLHCAVFRPEDSPNAGRPLACQRVPATGGPRHAESERGSFADRPMLGPLALPPPVRMGERGAEEWEVP